jgi:putative glycosyltransferase (TIGR04348 family)
VDPSEFQPESVREFDAFVALHARRSSDVIETFRSVTAAKPIVVALTGTDLHGDLSGDSVRAGTVLRSLELADKIVLLEPEGLKLLPQALHSKSFVIFQSALPVTKRESPIEGVFEVSVLGHLRDVKDPLLTARSSHLLPAESRIQIVQLGEALSPKMKQLAEEEAESNDRYRWLGAVSHQDAQQILARSRLTVLTSIHEGAPSVISEAVVNGVPILSTRIHASVGLLGADYPGLFQVDDQQQLAQLMRRAESDPSFYDLLITAVSSLLDRFSPELEEQNWQILLEQLKS